MRLGIAGGWGVIGSRGDGEDGGGFGYTSLTSVFFKKKKKQVVFERIRIML